MCNHLCMCGLCVVVLLPFGRADVLACPVASVNYAPVHWALGPSTKWSKDRRPFGDVKQSPPK